MGILFILIQFEIINDIQIILKKGMKTPLQKAVFLHRLTFTASLFLAFWTHWQKRFQCLRGRTMNICYPLFLGVFLTKVNQLENFLI